MKQDGNPTKCSTERIGDKKSESCPGHEEMPAALVCRQRPGEEKKDTLSEEDGNLTHSGDESSTPPPPKKRRIFKKGEDVPLEGEVPATSVPEAQHREDANKETTPDVEGEKAERYSLTFSELDIDNGPPSPPTFDNHNDDGAPDLDFFSRDMPVTDNDDANSIIEQERSSKAPDAADTKPIPKVVSAKLDVSGERPPMCKQITVKYHPNTNHKTLILKIRLVDDRYPCVTNCNAVLKSKEEVQAHFDSFDSDAHELHKPKNMRKRANFSLPTK